VLGPVQPPAETRPRPAEAGGQGTLRAAAVHPGGRGVLSTSSPFPERLPGSPYPGERSASLRPLLKPTLHPSRCGANVSAPAFQTTGDIHARRALSPSAWLAATTDGLRAAQLLWFLSGGGGIRTHEGPNGPQRFSRLPRDGLEITGDPAAKPPASISSGSWRREMCERKRRARVDYERLPLSPFEAWRRAAPAATAAAPAAAAVSTSAPVKGRPSPLDSPFGAVPVVAWRSSRG